MITVWIDELTPCLKDNFTGELIDTEVIQIRRKSFLKKYNKANQWYVNWDNMIPEFEVYALVIKGTVDIQGLVALKYDKEAKSTFVNWMVANPMSSPKASKIKQYSGIGGHLFAIAVDKSIEYGTEGEFYGFAANKELLDHYVNNYNATFLGILQDYHFILEKEPALAIKEEYAYEWTDEEL